MKTCSRCHETKADSDFRAQGRRCRLCRNAANREYAKTHPEITKAQKRRNYLRHKDAILVKTREYQKENRSWLSVKKLEAQRRRTAADPEKYRARERARRTGDNRPRYLELKRLANQRNRDAARKYERERWRTDPVYKIKCRLRWFLRMGVKGRHKAGRAEELLGCSVPDFRIYLESRFAPGMTREAFLSGEIHIDHIVPLALFDLTKPEHQRAALHFSNMQPLWAADNLSKSDKPPEKHQLGLI